MSSDAPKELIFAAAFTNSGFNRRGKFHRSRRDPFSRKRAREIIEGRIIKHLAVGKSLQFLTAIQTNKTQGEFMGDFRKIFKPKEEPEKWFQRGSSSELDWDYLCDIAKDCAK